MSGAAPVSAMPLEARSNHRISVPLILGIFVLLHAAFAAELWVDLAREGRARSLSPVELWQALDGSATMARGAGTTISRAYNVLVSMVLTSIALAIPLTANMYTPKLIEIFIKDKVNIAVLAFFVVSSAQAIWATQITWDQGALADRGGVYPRFTLWLAFESMTLGWSILIPYFYYVFRFLNPTNIIARVSDLVVDQVEAIPARGAAGAVEQAQRVLEQRIQNLGNVILRAIDRADRDVTLDAIRALKRVVFHYHTRKDALPPEWFAVAPDLWVGLSREALQVIRDERIWVEQKCLHQLALAYNASLAKMQDAISAISDVNRELALNAEAAADMGALRLGIRYFNTFIRESVKRRDVHAIFDVFAQYKELARDLLPGHPEITIEVGRHLKYYADFARANGLQFIYELASYEVESMVEWAYQRNAAPRRDLLAVLLSFDGEAASARIVKSRLIAGGFFVERGLAEEEAAVAKALEAAPRTLRDEAVREIVETKNPVFWEVTDRQINIDYVDEPRKRAIREFAGRIGAAAAAVEAPVAAPAPVGRAASPEAGRAARA